MPPQTRRKTVLLNWLCPDRQADTPLYKQIADEIRRAIAHGDLKSGTALPSSRVLAADLQVSRATTLQAYEVLQAEGLVETQRGSSTLVMPGLSGSQISRRARAGSSGTKPIDPAQKHLQKLYRVKEPAAVAFQPGIPAFDAFPRSLWSRLLARQAARDDPFLLDYAHVGGLTALRREIAGYLGASRGVRCNPEQVIVVTSVRSAIAAVSAVLWPRGSTIAVEDPGYVVARRVLKAAGHQLLPVRVDDRGLDADRLMGAPGGCAGAYLTPAHHWPTGVALDAGRRKRLLDWALDAGAWIIEDDYDSEYRFDSQPLAPLYALGSGRVIYVGTFSKTFAPSVRTAYLVVPPDHVEAFEQRAFIAATEPPLHVQGALADLMADGHFTRHISQMRKLYAQRRACLAEALEAEFGNTIKVVRPPGGLQLIAHLPASIPTSAVYSAASEIDLVARDLRVFYVNESPPNALQLGFAAVPIDQMGPAVARLAGVFSQQL